MEYKQGCHYGQCDRFDRVLIVSSPYDMKAPLLFSKPYTRSRPKASQKRIHDHVPHSAHRLTKGHSSLLLRSQ